MEDYLGNLTNYRAMPLVENYIGYYQSHFTENGTKKFDDQPIEFRYSDGTSDSYVKRGFDEEYVQAITRREGMEQAYRIFTTNAFIDFKPKDRIYIGDRQMHIVKVLPLLNTNDNIRHYNYDPTLYRRLAVKLIYLQ